MEEFIIQVVNRLGSLSKVSEILAKSGINIEGMATEMTENKGLIKIITNDANTTREALEKSRLSFTVENVIIVEVVNKPGELFKLTKKMADEKINIESIYMVSTERFAIRVDNIGKAKLFLKERIVG